MSVTTVLSRSVRRAPRNTLAPLDARRRAVASPRPLLAPVMTTTFPSMLDMVSPCSVVELSLDQFDGHFSGVWRIERLHARVDRAGDDDAAVGDSLAVRMRVLLGSCRPS